MDVEESSKPWFNYRTDKEQFQQRIKDFIRETEANLSASSKQEQICALERWAANSFSTLPTSVSQQSEQQSS